MPSPSPITDWPRRPNPRLNQVWVSDITCVRTAEGWLCVTAFLDLYCRRIVGWAASASFAAELILNALAMALRHRRPPALPLRFALMSVARLNGGLS